MKLQPLLSVLKAGSISYMLVQDPIRDDNDCRVACYALAALQRELNAVKPDDLFPQTKEVVQWKSCS